MPYRPNDRVVFSNGWSVTYRVIKTHWSRVGTKPTQFVDLQQEDGKRAGSIRTDVPAFNLTRFPTHKEQP